MDYSLALGDHTVIDINAERLNANNMRVCHSHSTYELYYLLKGTRILFADGSFYLVRAGDLFLVPPGMRHRTLDEGGGYEKLVVMLPSALIPQGAENTFRIVRPAVDAAASIRRDGDLVFLGPPTDFSGQARCFSAIVRLLCEVLTLPQCAEAPVASPAFGKVSQILDYMEKSYGQKISVSSIAERFFISDYYLCRIFKEYTGRTVNEYLTELRTEAAEHLLLQGVPLPSVRRACGFGSDSSFNRVFRQKNGCSAGQFLKKNGVRKRK